MFARAQTPVRRWLGKSRLWASCAAAVVLAGGLIAAAYWFAGRGAVNQPRALPPEIDLSHADPAVARAVTDARQAVLNDPQSAAAWGQLALHLIGHRFPADTAVIVLAEAERLDPHDPRWPYYLAESLETTDPPRAIDKLRRAIELLGEKSDQPRFHLAELLLSLDRFDEAAAALAALPPEAAASPRAELDQARVGLRRGDLDQALRHARLAQADPHTRKAALQLAAQTLARLGQAELARSTLDAAGKLPSDLAWPDPWRRAPTQLRTGQRVGLARAARLLVENQPAEAGRRVREVLAEHPDSAQGWLLLGRCLIADQQLGEAEQALTKSVKLGPQSAEARFYLGIAIYLQRRVAEAADCFQQAVDIDPAFAPAWQNLAACRQDLDDRPGAVAALRAAIRAKPNEAATHEDLGLLLAGDGKTAEAAQHLREALSLNPSSKVARDRLQELEATETTSSSKADR